jgi:hypothetical protein
VGDLLMVGQTCTADEMNDFIKGKHQGGIRYSGNYPDYECIGVVIGGGADAIYPDENRGDVVRYIGEGQRGNQKLTFGNRALTWAFLTELPVHLFVRAAKNSYSYGGAYVVDSVESVISGDCTGVERGAFCFELVRGGVRRRAGACGAGMGAPILPGVSD